MTSMAKEIREAAAELGRSLRREGPVLAYLEAEQAFRSCGEAVELEQRLYSLYETLMARQRQGEQLSREEVQAFHELRRQVQSHPIVSERDRALQAAKPHLAEVADEISVALGIDYTSLARPEE